MTDTTPKPVEIAWFGALCDDDYEFLGVPDPELRSSWPHCRDIVTTADSLGFDNILLPSGYKLGIDTVSFASAIAPMTQQIRLLVAVRMGEMWVPQLARQLGISTNYMSQVINEQTGNNFFDFINQYRV